MSEPTGEAQTRLFDDLNDAGAPDWMLEKVVADFYHDFESPHPAPKHLLVHDLNLAGLTAFEEAVKTGEYDDSPPGSSGDDVVFL